MKTNLFWARSLALLLAFLTFSSAAPAQEDDSPDYFRRPLRVQTAAGKQPTIADFARAFASADQEKDPLFSAILARIDGRQPKLPKATGSPASSTVHTATSAPATPSAKAA